MIGEPCADARRTGGQPLERRWCPWTPLSIEPAPATSSRCGRDVSILDQTVDRVVVGMEGLIAPVEVRSVNGLELSEAERAAVLDALSSDTWPSWDYE